MRETRFYPWVGKISWRRKWQPTPVFLSGKSHGLRILVGYSPWRRKTTERLHFHFLPQHIGGVQSSSWSCQLTTKGDSQVQVLFSRSVMSDSLQPHGLHAARQASLSITSPRACSNSCPSSRWCHPTVSSSVIPFSSCLQSFPAWGSFPVSRLFASSGQSIGASASASVLSVAIQDWFPLGLTGLILLSKGLSRVFSSTIARRHQFFGAQPFLLSCCHIYMWLLEKPWLWFYGPL